MRVPYTEHAFREEARYRRAKFVSAVVGVGALAVAFGFVGLGLAQVWLAIAGAGLGVTLFCHAVAVSRGIRTRLDASRR